MLKQDFKEGEMTLSSALALAVKVLNKTMDVSKLSAEKGEAKCQMKVTSIVLLVLLTQDYTEDYSSESLVPVTVVKHTPLPKCNIAIYHGYQENKSTIQI